MSAMGVPNGDDTSAFSASKFNQQGRFAPAGTPPPQIAATAAAPQFKPATQFQPTPPAGAVAPPSYTQSAENETMGALIRPIGFHQTFKWKPTSPENDRLEAKPLLAALKQQGLSPDENFNVHAIYLESTNNASRAPIAIQMHNVNGANLTKKAIGGNWATHIVQPGVHDYRLLNNGKGLLLAKNALDMYGNVNVQSLTPEDLIKQAETHEDYLDASGKPTHYIVPVNLSAFSDPHSTLTEDEKFAEATQLGRIVYANAKGAFNGYPGIENALFNLPPLTPGEGTSFSDISVTENLVGKKRGRFEAVIAADELRDAIDHYGEVLQSAQPTSAHDHKISVFRVGQKNGEHIGDIKNELGVTSSDIDRAKQSYSGVHLDFNYEIQHNGKPYTGK